MVKREKRRNQRTDIGANEPPSRTAGRAQSPPTFSDELPDAKRMLLDFMAAHSDGMTALQKRDYAKLGEAIEREQDLIAEQRALIEQQRREMERVIRGITQTLSGHRATRKVRKR